MWMFFLVELWEFILCKCFLDVSVFDGSIVLLDMFLWWGSFFVFVIGIEWFFYVICEFLRLFFIELWCWSLVEYLFDNWGWEIIWLVLWWDIMFLFFKKEWIFLFRIFVFLVLLLVELCFFVVFMVGGMIEFRNVLVGFILFVLWWDGLVFV